MKRHTRNTISEGELTARYEYLLGTLPHNVAEKAHASALAAMSAVQRRGILDCLLAPLAEEERERAADDPETLAALVGRPESRDAMRGAQDAGALALQFVTSPPIATYFSVGAGSVSIDQQPPWVQELAGHDSAPINAGTIHHRKGVNSGIWF